MQRAVRRIPVDHDLRARDLVANTPERGRELRRRRGLREVAQRLPRRRVREVGERVDEPRAVDRDRIGLRVRQIGRLLRLAWTRVSGHGVGCSSAAAEADPRAHRGGGVRRVIQVDDQA